MSNNIRYQLFVAVSANLREKILVVSNVLAHHEQEIYPTNWLNKNCIEFEFWADWNYYVDSRETYFALKLKFVKGFGYETYNTKTLGKSTSEKQKRMWKRSRGKSLQLLSILMSATFCTQFFPTSRYTSTTSKFSIQMDSLRTSLTFPTISREQSLKTLEFSLRGVWLLGISWRNYGSAFVWNFFHKGKKLLGRNDGCMSYGKKGVDFSSTSELL